MNVSKALFLGGLLVALGGWGSSFQTWDQLLQVSNFFGLLAILGGVILAKFSQSPIGKNGGKS